jgi:hypothetical protein
MRLFLSLCRSVTLLVVIALGWLTFVTPPPHQPPDSETISWQEDPHILVDAFLLFCRCSTVQSYGPVTRCSISIPIVDERLDFVGVRGRWYLLDRVKY